MMRGGSLVAIRLPAFVPIKRTRFCCHDLSVADCLDHRFLLPQRATDTPRRQIDYVAHD